MSSSFNAPGSQVLHDLKAVVGDEGWKPAADGARYFEDPRGRFKGRASLIVLPDSTEQVAQVVRICNDAKVGIVPFSGGTGVVAGQMSVDSDAAIVLSLERMNKVREVLIDDGAIVVEAGCILENIHHSASAHDLMFPLSMASKGSCCIGGNLATNAGGIQVVRHGNARDLCLGIEAVLPDGSIYSALSPLRKDNTGYDLRHLLIGSEGTLGIITAATLVLKPVDPETVTVLCAIASPGAGLELYKHIRKQLGESISALELMSDFGLRLVTTHFPALSIPFTEDHDWYLLLEASGPTGIRDRLEEVLEACLEGELLFDAVVAQSQTQQKSLWDLRENTPEANRAGGAFCNSDTSVPISKVGAFIAQTTRMIHDIHPGLRMNTYGHIGDGNIHHNVLPPEGISKSEFVATHPEIVKAVRMAINEATRMFDGSISAEHGIGRLKTEDLELYASPEKQALLRRIKSALDPNNIMNPGAMMTDGPAH
ncbi:FAD-binding oxidoreductase [Tateyamaria pelophila]|uniref:FAD-binding oxidoreductase n=1 Tax=Tateyamaria pelophila TaxID=328415 RepID=UPI001CC0E796|nr:FAD-binding oxidoreductase [Tateyamaria pelophila]